jgi:hypothetical protein
MGVMVRLIGIAVAISIGDNVPIRVREVFKIPMLRVEVLDGRVAKRGAAGGRNRIHDWSGSCRRAFAI